LHGWLQKLHWRYDIEATADALLRAATLTQSGARDE
jgi:ADP-ribosyl-[dinitrogen reductase] hydrolase